MQAPSHSLPTRFPPPRSRNPPGFSAHTVSGFRSGRSPSGFLHKRKRKAPAAPTPESASASDSPGPAAHSAPAAVQIRSWCCGFPPGLPEGNRKRLLFPGLLMRTNLWKFHSPQGSFPFSSFLPAFPDNPAARRRNVYTSLNRNRMPDIRIHIPEFPGNPRPP